MTQYAVLIQYSVLHCCFAQKYSEVTSLHVSDKVQERREKLFSKRIEKPGERERLFLAEYKLYLHRDPGIQILERIPLFLAVPCKGRKIEIYRVPPRTPLAENKNESRHDSAILLLIN